ncbi:FecR family protein [Pedobacter insulae]|uniref:Ferric-dicitrate binding protein FerR, regulates iron transport through sigma-19 n=1 Tax=Pedobacter insulae TaxID=414048 RepID=A0A1I2TEP9_9SPHI|nr:FecR domain-containing protein [Pedobacter insulae]SFG63434.1 ferric-dicitrate binding protein FerR, regulates iron transport through sigma-19 [Pedobacter insulae]
MLINDESLALITRYLNNTSDETLQQAVAAFRSASSENEAYFSSMERLWHQSAKAGVLEEINVADAAKRLKNNLPQNASKPQSAMVWIRGVAASLLILSLGYWIFSHGDKPNYLVRATSSGQIDSVKLPDGSVVILAGSSELVYPDKFNSSTREISLIKGEAFFKIIRDVAHPFKVAINESEVVVLGTSFNIEVADSAINLGVKTGKVSFSPYKSAAASILTAGQAISYDVKKREVSSKTAENEDAWLTKELVFVDTPLEEVCRQLTDYYKIEIKLQDNKQHSKKLNARFTNQPLDDVLLVLKAAYSFEIKKENNQINLITP